MKKIDISTSTILRIVFLILLIWFLYKIIDIIAILFLAIIIASAVDPLAAWFSKRKVPRIIAVLAIYLVAIGILGFMTYLVVPTLVGELRELSQTFPRYWGEIFPEEFFDQRPLDLPSAIQQILAAFGTGLDKSVSGIFSFTSSIFGGALAAISVIMISFYLSVKEGEIEKFLKTISPEKYRSYIVGFWERVHKKFAHWLQGQLLLMLIVGALTFVGLSLLGIRYSLILAILAGLFEIIPIAGPILAAIPAIILATLEDPLLGAAVVILYIVIQQIENNLIVPAVFKKIVGIHPVVVLLALLIGARFGGTLGLLIAVPAAAAIGEVINDIEKRRGVKL